MKEAMNEIRDLPPVDRRAYVVEFLSKYLPWEDAKRILFQKDPVGYLYRMLDQGYTTPDGVLELIGTERVRYYVHKRSLMS